ncbi:MAG TPA: sugar ABC transporter substrate-binding protein [Fimbriimonadaceae bacterium]|nr:sugar ABC transporter substrate-binding protein [Fimbriimonadaceae bacterium]
MRRWLATIAAVAILFAPGCRPEESGTVVLRIANWGGAGDDNEFSRTVRDLYRQFEAENPGVTIRVESIPGSQNYVSKMLLSYIAGSQPDVMALDASSAAVFIDNGALLDLQPSIERDPTFRIDDFFPNVVDIARRGKALYAIPGDFTPMVLYYNKRLFDAAGVPHPKDNWTFDEFLDAAKKLTIPGDRPGDPPKQFGFKFANWMPGWITWLWNNDGDVLSPSGDQAGGYLDGPGSIDAVQFLIDLVDKHRVAPSLSQAAAAGVDLFLTERAAMEISGHWSLVSYGAKDADGKPIHPLKVEDVGVTTVPTRRGRSVTVMYESGLAIGKHCRHPEVAWKFIRFMTSKAVQSRYNATGIAVCGRRDVAAASAVGNPLKQKFLEIVPTARPPWGSRVEGYDFVETTGQKAMDNALGGTPVPVALREGARRIDGYFRIR